MAVEQPVGFVKEKITEAQWPDRIRKAVKQINSVDPRRVIKGLNALLVKSSEWDSNYVLQLEMYPDLIIALGSLLDTINPVGGMVFSTVSSIAGKKRKLEDDDRTYINMLLDEHQNFINWLPDLPSAHNPHFRALSITLDDNPLLLNTLTIIRNLSFEACNEVPIASSYPIMRHLVTVLMSSYGSLSMSEASQTALDTILNISGRWDLTGQRRLSTSYFLEDCLADRKQFPNIRLRAHSTMSLMSKLDYQEVVQGMLSYVFNSLQQTVDMAQTLRGLELLTKLAGNTDNADVFASCPDELLDYIVDLLCTNVTAVEPFHVAETTTLLASRNALSGGSSIVIPPVTPKKSARMPAATGPFYTYFSDTDVRDQALEAMQVLCQNVPDMRVRFAHIPNCLRLLVKIISSRENKQLRAATDPTMQRVTNIIALMALKKSENMMKFKAVYSELAVGAFGDDALQEVFCGTVLEMVGIERSVHGGLGIGLGVGASGANYNASMADDVGF
jgi:hypothetical protein